MNNIPEGYRLVPVEPTSSMLESGKDERMDCFTNPSLSVEGALVRIYKAMLAAATPPQPIYDQTKERELFASLANEAYGVAEDEELNMKNPAIKENLNGWLACAQSRAKAGEDE